MAALGAIRSVTVTTPNLEATAAAYRDFLGYVDAGSGQISPALAQAWACPGEAGQDYLLLKPASGVDFWMRLVATEPVADYRPLTSYGWNASEIIVQDVDQLAEQLADSPFQIIGPPEDLSFSDAIRAMQVRGPADEVVYLTQFKRPVPAFDVPDALSFVARVFIMIVGGPDLAAIQRYYEETFAVPPAPVMDAVVSVLASDRRARHRRQMLYRGRSVPGGSRGQTKANRPPAPCHSHGLVRLSGPGGYDRRRVGSCHHPSRTALRREPGRAGVWRSGRTHRAYSNLGNPSL
jgi:hypothetical protein